MRSELLPLAAVAAFALAGCTQGSASAGTTRPAPERADPMALKATGEPVRCVSNRANVSTKPAGPNVLMFRTGSNRWFRNELRSACPAMRDDRVLVFRSSTSQHCELDIFDVVDPLSRINFGVCSLGRFTPVDVPRGTRF